LSNSNPVQLFADRRPSLNTAVATTVPMPQVPQA